MLYGVMSQADSAFTNRSRKQAKPSQNAAAAPSCSWPWSLNFSQFAIRIFKHSIKNTQSTQVNVMAAQPFYGVTACHYLR